MSLYVSAEDLRMMLYKIIDGAYLGFYQEYGGTVFISGYRTIIKKQWVIRDREVTVWVPEELVWYQDFVPAHDRVTDVFYPEHYETVTQTVPGEWLFTEIWVAGHWEDRRYWIEENCWYESKTIEILVLGVMTPVSRMVEVCEPAHWGVREQWIPGWWKELSEWVPEHEIEVEILVPAQHKTEVVTVPGGWVSKSRTVDAHWDTSVTMCGGWDMVEFEDPIFSYYGEREEYCLVARKRGPVLTIAGEPEGDSLKCRITGTDQWVTFEADYLCCATSIGENQYVNPG